MRKLHRYTQEQINYIGTICGGRLKSEIREMFNERFDLNVTPSSIRSIMERNGFKNGLRGKAGASTHFQKGHEPWNKNVKGLQLGGEAGWFKKGHAHWKTMPLGSEVESEGQWWIKTANPSTWTRKHLHVWREANGEIPEGMVIRFKDGNKLHVELDNLFMVEHRVMTSVVRRKMDSSIPEVKVAIHNLAKLQLTISDKEKTLKG